METNLGVQPSEPTSSVEPPSPPTPQPSVDIPQPPKSKRWLLPVIISILLIILGITGYFTYQYFQLQQQTTPPPSPTPTPTPDPTADWETYTNDQYSFSISYPPDWALHCTEPKDDTWLSRNICDLRAPETSLDHGQLLNGAYMVVGSNKPNPNYSNLREYVNFSANQDNYSSASKTINDINGYQLTSAINSVFVFESKGHFIVINWIPLNENDSNHFTINQILSTFKLTETTSDWKQTKESLMKIVEEYLNALMAENRQLAISYLTDAVKPQVIENWPQGYGAFVSYEVLNEFTSEQEEIDFYSRDQITLTIKLYKENDQIGSQTNLLFVKENGSWKTLTWYLFP